MKLKSIIAAAALLFGANTAIAKVWHVNAQTGSNTYDGTAEQPLKTISKAAHYALAADTVMIYSGTYREWVSPENGGINDMRRITYMAVPNNEVKVKGSEVVTNWKKDGKQIWKTVVNNDIFGDFNPFDISVFGDWLYEGGDLHLGEVYINEQALNEVRTREELTTKDFGWYAEVSDEFTTIYAAFKGDNPNKALTEINVRPACFFPKTTGMNYITVQGLNLSQAATQWAPPTGEQIGLMGPNWSKGWIIEDCTVSHSRCVGISLGKERASGQNMWHLYEGKFGYMQHGFNREIEAIIKAEDLGWSYENIGSHIVRNNKIFECGQAGIVGHLGCIFSTISNNEIINIGVNGQLQGAEMAGIKLHAPIDAVIENNLISNTARGMWLDWQVQGTHIRGNVIEKSENFDIFVEVSHEPTLIYNNILLTDRALRMNAQGIAVFNNLIAGTTYVHCSTSRFTPYHVPHSTKIKGFFNSTGGDVRFYNNIFIASDAETKESEFCGLSPYDTFPLYNDTLTRKGLNLMHYQKFKFPIWTAGNVYYQGTKTYKNETEYTSLNLKPTVHLEKHNEGYYLQNDIDFTQLEAHKGVKVTTEKMGQTFLSETLFENTDATPFVLEYDIYGNKRNADKPTAGPFELNTNQNVWETK